jgi:tetratricopeptide (TPR) repeat protein
MARARRINEAIQLSEAFFESEELTFAAQQFWIAAFLQSESLSPNEQEYLRAFTHRRIQRAEEANNRKEAATWHYNLGNHLRGSGQFRLAFHHYRKAAKYDSKYKERKYFWRELGGVLFELDHYNASANFYARAIRLGEKGHCRALYSDALMFAGKYRKAQQEFERYLASAKDSKAEWRLKARVLSRVRALTGVDEQVRQTRVANELVERAIKASAEKERRKLLEEALEYDALCGLAWFNLGVSWSKSGKRWYAFFSFLIAGLCQRKDVEAWVNVVALGSSLKSQRFLIPYIIETAYFFNRERLMEQFAKFAQSQPKGFPAAKFLNIVSETLSAIPKERQPIEIRLLKKGAEYDVIKPQRDESNEDKER